MGVIPWSPLAGGWLTGQLPQGPGPADQRRRADPAPPALRPDVPGNQRKLDAVEALAVLAEEAGLPLVHLAVAFVIAHPAVTAAIIGPRTMEQLETPARGGRRDARATTCSTRIDQIVPPGTNLNAADAGWESPALSDARRRRR